MMLQRNLKIAIKEEALKALLWSADEQTHKPEGQ